MDILFVSQYFFAKKFSLLAKGGMSFVEQKIEMPHFFNNPQSTIKNNCIVPKAGIGANYSISAQHNLGIIYNYAYGKKKIRIAPNKDAAIVIP